MTEIGQHVRVELSDKTILCGRLTYEDDDWVEISHVDVPGNRQRSLIPRIEVISMSVE
jgi:hypothetical protein